MCYTPATTVTTPDAVKPLQFDTLVNLLKTTCYLLPEHRRGFNTTHTLQNAALAAFSVFFTQSPSFLAYQKQMQENHGKNNAQSLFQLDTIPSDNQIRNLLDPIEPGCFSPIFSQVFEHLLTQGYLSAYRHINNTLLIALDGVQYHSSSTVSCDKCHRRQHKNGDVTYSHSAITPVIVAPGQSQVISLLPEFITPQDGHTKQDSEHAAATRWLRAQARHYQALGVTFLGDDLYDCQPICTVMLEENCHFVLTCKPDSHKTLYEYVNELDTMNYVNSKVVKRRRGKKVQTDTYRFVNRVPIRDSDDALQVNWCELVTTNQDGKVLYRNAFVTDHQINENNVVDVVEAGRARWKIENENNNTLKTKGYNLKHNFGHGKQFLSQCLFALNILAFLFHTVLQFMDDYYQLIRAKLPSRKTFFDDIRALTRYMYFESWSKMMLFMMEGLEIPIPNTS